MDIFYYCRNDDNIDLEKFKKHLIDKYNIINIKIEVISNYFNYFDNFSINCFYITNDNLFIEKYYNYYSFKYYCNLHENKKIINIKNYLLTEKLKTLI